MDTSTALKESPLYDVIIVGAGAVGLLFAEALARNFDVALLEKRESIGTDKSWWVPKSWLYSAGLEKYITHDILSIGLYCQGVDVVKKLPQESVCSCIDEEKYFPDYASKFQAAGGDLFLGTRVIHSSSVKKDRNTEEHIRVFDDKGKLYKGRLVLDCSGVDSVFVERDANIKHNFYWNVYGRLFEGVQDLSNTSYIVRCYEYEFEGSEWDGQKIFINDVPEGNEKYTPWLHFISDKRASIPQMRRMYRDILGKPYLKPKLGGVTAGKEKFGWIPAQDFKYRSRDRVLSLGDAGGMAPFQNAMSFSLAVYKKDQFVSSIASALNEDTLGKNTLDKIVEFNRKEEFNFDFGKLVFSGFMNSTIDEFIDIIELFDEWGIERVSKFLFLLDGDMDDIFLLIIRGIKKLGVKKFVDILNRDGFGDEVRIITELVEDSISR
jgi:flavin-dependent dehydrogenase